jgi:hypothetical protein
MKMTIAAAFFLALLLAGCIGPAEKDCGQDNECLKSAFMSCSSAHGTWHGENGDFEIHIVKKQVDRCRISVHIPGTAMNISGKEMSCDVPIYEDNSTFSISSDCTGELASFFK